MASNTSGNLVHPVGNVTTQRVAVSHPVMAFWHTMIGKKVVMAVTGVVLVGFVIAHMVGNLKIFTGPDEINAYSRFLREVGSPGLAYGELLWIVRAVLLTCVALHITAAFQLSRMSWAARPVGYSVKRNIETTFSARVMRWGGVLLVVFIIFHLLHLTAGAVGFRCRTVQTSRRLPERHASFHCLAGCALLRRSDGCALPPLGPRNLEHAANPWLEYGSKRKELSRSHHEQSQSWSFLDSAQFLSRSGQAGCINR